MFCPKCFFKIRKNQVWLFSKDKRFPCSGIIYYLDCVNCFPCYLGCKIQDEVECTAGQNLEVTENESVAELETEQPDRDVDTIQVHY